MINRLVLDTGPLGRACHPHARRNANVEFNLWLERLIKSGTEVCVSEIADYELRRELLRLRAAGQVARLDRLISQLTFLPLDRETMLAAAALWANARNAGQPTSDSRELDCDAILAAQAQIHGCVVVTDNVGHLSRWVDARHWHAVDPGEGLNG